MKIKRSFAIPEPVEKWLLATAEEQGLSVSALLTHILMEAIKEERKRV